MITVINKYHNCRGESVMRPSPLGNPFSHMEGTLAQFKVETRDEAILKFREWLIEQINKKNPAVLAELNRLLKLARQGDLNLKCCCAPKACHADVIKEFLEVQMSRSEMIFVFGSNTSGHHGAGAALTAKLHHGAEAGRGEGLSGKSYALPTCGPWNGRKFPALSHREVELAIYRFIQFTMQHPEVTFKVTRVGCGLAGYEDKDIAPLFRNAPENCLFDTTWKTWLPSKKFWGTY